MSDILPTSPPDRLSTNQRSPHFDLDTLQRGIGIRFKGRERTDVEEYSISESWIRVAAGKSRDRHGNPLTIKLNGEVEAWFLDTVQGDAGEGEASNVENPSVEVPAVEVPNVQEEPKA